jgi:hypothetical protein
MQQICLLLIGKGTIKLAMSKIKIISIALCLAALAGFILPAVNIGIEFLGNSRSISLSIRTLFENSGSRFGGSDLSQADLFNLSDSNMFENLLADVRTVLITSVGAYFMTLILLIIILIFIFTGKFNKAIVIMSGVSVALLAYAGSTILSVTEILLSTLESSLGFLAMFINLSDLLKINLGIGYWLTMITLGCLLVLKIADFFYGKFMADKET